MSAACDCLLPATLGTTICLSALTPSRQATPVTKPSVASDVNQPPDVLVNLSAQVTLHHLFTVHNFPDASHLYVV